MLSDVEIKEVEYYAERAVKCLESIVEVARGKDSNVESLARHRINDIRIIVKDAKLR